MSALFFESSKVGITGFVSDLLNSLESFRRRGDSYLLRESVSRVGTRRSLPLPVRREAFSAWVGFL